MDKQFEALFTYLTIVLVYTVFLFKIEIYPNNFRFALSLGIVYRLLPCIIISATFSNDIVQYGYLGNKILSGQIPYKDFPAPYPPLSLYISVPFLIIGDLRLLKLFFVLCDLAIIFLLCRMLKSQNISVEKIKMLSLILLFFPPLLLEFSVSGHNDSFTLLLLIASLALLHDKQTISASFLGLSICSKIFPLATVPFLLKQQWAKNKKTASHFLLTLASSLALISTPFILLSPNAFFGMLFGATRYTIPYGFFQMLMFKLLNGSSDSLIMSVLIVSSAISTIIFLSIFIYSHLRDWSLTKSLSIIFMLLPFLLPQFQPWYLLWALPFVILHASENRKMIVVYLVLLSVFHFLSYLLTIYNPLV